MVLDKKRLGKQRVEALQLLRGNWPNHPAAKMWEGYKPALAEYGRICCEVWKTVHKGTDTIMQEFELTLNSNIIEMPNWFGLEKFHASHRANLLRKDFEFYFSRNGWQENPMLPYVWPRSDRCA